MTDRWMDQLSAYVDAELRADERAELEAHLSGCAECRGVLEELRGVVARATALEDREPTRDLWSKVAREIKVERVAHEVAPRARRLSFSVPQLLAASIALILLSGSAVWLAVTHRATSRTSPTMIAAGRTPEGSTTARVAWATDPRYDAAIAELQAALQAGRRSGQLDSATIRIVEHNLAIIDTAIVQARRALAADPGSAYLNHHLADTMRRKLDLRRQATAISGART
jgi:predicted anti-sigma-YlaC factor YlaD